MKKMHAAMLFILIAALMVGIAQASQGSKEVNASEVLEKIALGEEVAYEKVIITGNLDMSALNLSRDDFGRRIIASDIRINDSLINGDVNLDHSNLMGKIDLSGTTLCGNASFSHSRFASIALLRNASFLKHADFTWTEFMSWLDLSNAVFSQGAHFDHSEIYEFANLSFASFKGYVSFKDTVFSSYALLTGTRFDNDVNFYRAEFHRETRFDGARFLGYANFNDSRFGDYAYFLGTDFQGPVSLNHTRISDLMMDWSTIKGHLIYNEAAYHALMQKFWDSGDFEDYDDCYYQHQWQRQSYQPMGISKGIDILSGILCGYGVKPLRILAIWLIVIIFFAMIYWRMGLVPRFINAERANPSKGKESMILALEDALHFSAMVFVTGPPYGLPPAGRWRFLIVLEYVLGWLIMAFFLVVMARLIIR